MVRIIKKERKGTHQYEEHHKETSDELKEGMETGEKDENLDTEEGREGQVEEDEIEPWEEGFMEGAAVDGQLAKDALTGEPLMDVDDVVEAEIEGNLYRFVSQENAQKFREKKKKQSQSKGPSRIPRFQVGKRSKKETWGTSVEKNLTRQTVDIHELILIPHKGRYKLTIFPAGRQKQFPVLGYYPLHLRVKANIL